MLRTVAIIDGQQETRTDTGSRWVEVAVLYGLLEGALWTSGRAQLIWGLLMLSWAAAITLTSGWTRQQLGWGRSGLKASAWVVPAAVAACALIVVTGWAGGTLHPWSGAHLSPGRAISYGIWALVQEFMAQSCIYLRLEEVWRGSRRAVVMTAVLFSLAHLPNPVLLPATFLAALALTTVFRRFRNLYPIAVAHALLGLALAAAVPCWATHQMRVGIAYWR